jgi:hypothetical protein
VDNKEILNTVLNFKYLEYWRISYHLWKGIEISKLPSNHSIECLEFGGSIPAHLTLKIINACKILETLNIGASYFSGLDLLKFERKVNILKLSYGNYTLDIINKIDSSTLFN